LQRNITRKKSANNGLKLLARFLGIEKEEEEKNVETETKEKKTRLSKRIIACLDVRANDNGDLVVTKGDQYDVREKTEDGSGGEVRNLGKPVDLARRYYEEGADEITFLNITSFREGPITDAPMLEVLKRTSKNVFVPLTIGGGIRDYTDKDGNTYSALDVASEYFRSGADKVSIGSDAVYAAEEYLKAGKQKSGKSSIEQISGQYGRQAVVVSVDPKRVWLSALEEEECKHHIVRPVKRRGPKGETACWYQCTVKGGREGREIDANTLAQAVAELGAGELLLNCMDEDGAKQGFDIDLIGDVASSINIPVIASSGAGAPEHFAEVFEKTGVEAGLAAGIFHRREVPISAVKQHMKENNLIVRD